MVPRQSSHCVLDDSGRWDTDAAHCPHRQYQREEVLRRVLFPGVSQQSMVLAEDSGEIAPRFSTVS